MRFLVTLGLAYAAIVVASRIGILILFRPDPQEAHRDSLEQGVSSASPGDHWYDNLSAKFLGSVILSPVMPVLFVIGLWVRFKYRHGDS